MFEVVRLGFLWLCIAATPFVHALDWSEKKDDVQMASIISCVWESSVLVDIVKETVTRDRLVAETQAQADSALLVVCTYLDRFCFFVSVLQREGTWTLTRIGPVKEYVSDSKQNAVSTAQKGADLYYIWNPFATKERWIKVSADSIKVTCKDQPYPLSRIWFLPDGINLVGIEQIDQGTRFVTMSYADAGKTEAIVKNSGSLFDHQWKVEEDLAQHLVDVYPHRYKWLSKTEFKTKFCMATVTCLEALGSEVAQGLRLTGTQQLRRVQPTGDGLGDSFFAIFVQDGDVGATVVAAEKVLSGEAVLTYMSQWTSITAAEESIRTYYAIALTSEFRNASEKWLFEFEMNNNSDWNKVNFKKLTEHIIAAVPFSVDTEIYLQKGRRMKGNKNNFVAIYSYMGKLFMVAFRKEKGDIINLLHISSLVSDKELAKIYDGYIKSKTAFTEQALKNSVGVFGKMPDIIERNSKSIFDGIMADWKLAEAKWESTDVDNLEKWVVENESGRIPPPPHRVEARVTWFAVLCKVACPSTETPTRRGRAFAPVSSKFNYFYRIAVFHDSVYQGILPLPKDSSVSYNAEKARSVLQCRTVRPLHDEMLANSKLKFKL